MRRSWAAVTVGVLTIAVLAASFFLFTYTREGISDKEGYTVFARFRDAQGLVSKSRVQTAGLPVGKIANRELDATVKERMAKITVRLEPWVKVYENALISK
jgi:phospholipid/cholesterol/gamma-HCH transport system substrate-binding protein